MRKSVTFYKQPLISAVAENAFSQISLWQSITAKA